MILFNQKITSFFNISISEKYNFWSLINFLLIIFIALNSPVCFCLMLLTVPNAPKLIVYVPFPRVAISS